MKILHILRSEPDEMVLKLIRAASESEESVKIALYGKKEVDYDRLVEEIFENDRVICWW